MNIGANQMEVPEINGIMRKRRVLTGVKMFERENTRWLYKMDLEDIIA